MRHTYLLVEAAWEAHGRYWDDTGQEILLSGTAVISHQEELWRNHSTMQLALETAVEFESNYEITPMLPGEHCARWSSHNPTLGHMLGTFALVGDSIISSYTSDSGEYSGCEYFLQMNEHIYKVAGVLFHGAERLSSWEATLVRQ
ncbi:hypothetical protein ACFL43_02140 [Thermodesulfobacteriota bacterium]